MSTNDPTIRWLIEILSRWVRTGELCREIPPCASPEVLLDVAKRGRLEPLLNTILVPDPVPSHWAGALAGLAEMYRKSLVRGLNHLKAGAHLCGELEAKGIPCIALRGPFAATALYGDVGARYFADLDLLVRRDQRDRALKVVEGLGFALRNPRVPSWFYRRHHLHWPLWRPTDGMLCDLHWQIDHPYKLLGVDYGDVFAASRRAVHGRFSWRDPCPEHQLLITCLHLAKECRTAAQIVRMADAAETMAHNGSILLWLNVALVIRRHGAGLAWTRIECSAEEWNAGQAVAAGLVGAATVFGAEVPPQTIERFGVLLAGAPARAASMNAAWAVRLARLAGFRPDVVRDAWTFLFPPRTHFGTSSSRLLRSKHFMRALGLLLWGGLETVACLVIVGWRGLRPETANFRKDQVQAL